MSSNSVKTVTCKSGSTRLAIVAAAVPAPPPPTTIRRSVISLLQSIASCLAGRHELAPGLGRHEVLNRLGLPYDAPAAALPAEDGRARLPELGRGRLLVGAHATGEEDLTWTELRQLRAGVHHVDVLAQRAGHERRATAAGNVPGGLDPRRSPGCARQQVGAGVAHQAAPSVGEPLDRDDRED